jgi:hypothetical protein
MPWMFVLTLLAFGQDWPDCQPNGSYSFRQVKGSVRRMTSNHIYAGWDDKAFSRAGDMVSVAILQTLDDSEMTSSALAEVLAIIRSAFACPSRCVIATSDRQPRVTLLLLEHLRNNTAESSQSEIDETKQYVLRQTGNH